MSNYPSWMNYTPLRLRNWDKLKNGMVGRMCGVKSIAIHYTEVPGQKAIDVYNYYNSELRDDLPKGSNYDLDSLTQGSDGIGAHFIIDDTEIRALAPTPEYTFWHVGDQWARPANPNAWNKNKTKYVRGVNYYAICIEHCYTDPTGKFSSSVLQKSHRVVNWLKNKYGVGVDIGRHFDFSGKPCPLWFAPVIPGKNDSSPRSGRKKIPENPIIPLEIALKNNRWNLLLAYYKQPDYTAIPPGLE